MRKTWVGVVGSVAIVCAFQSSAFATSAVYQSAPPFHATDIAAGALGAFDATADGRIVSLVGLNVNLYSSSGVFQRTITTVPDYGTGTKYAAFTRLSPDASQVWVGFTTSGNADDRIYSAPFAGGAATYQATLAGNYDLEFAKVAGDWKPFVSGAGWAAPNSVWLLNTSGGASTKVAELGGYGSGIAFDSAGNLYAANQTAQKLYRFSASNVQNAAQGLTGFLVTDNANFSTDTIFAASDITVDGAGNVFFNANDPSYGGKSVVCLLRPADLGPYKYDNIASGSAGYNWSSQLAFGGGTGDVTQGQGAVYVADYYGFYDSTGHVTAISTPEPASVALVGSAFAGLLGALRRRAIRR